MKLHRLAVTMLIAATAITSAHAERVLRNSAVIDASADEIWKALTTTEGVKASMGLPVAEVDFRIGGAMRANYDPKSKIGDPGTIVNTYLAYEPGVMIAMKPTAPDGAPPFIKKFCETGWTIMRLEPLGKDQTRLVISQAGYGEGELYDQAYKFFDHGNSWTLGKMKEALEHHKEGGEPKADSTDEVMEALKKLSGEWRTTMTSPDGGSFRARVIIEEGPGGHAVLMRGWLGDAKALKAHALTVVRHDGERNRAVFESVDQEGTVAAGDITLNAGKLEWDWQTTTAAGDVGKRWQVVKEVKDASHFTFTLLEPQADGTMKQAVNLTYERVGDAPKVAEWEPVKEPVKK